MRSVACSATKGHQLAQTSELAREGNGDAAAHRLRPALPLLQPKRVDSELPVILSHDDGKHRPLDRSKTWMDLRKGNQIVLWYPGKAPQVRRVDQVILWMSHPTVNGLPEIVSGRDWIENGTIIDPR